ncbi:MAG TPA: MFS transporter [Chloroflexota bacterium]|nr:MFS transporter [Chloroflexota bacterium]
MSIDQATTATSKPARRLNPTFASFSSYNFRLYWSGGLVSQIGTWMQMIAQPWLVLEITHSPVALGAVTALQSLPVLFLALFAGVYVDRFPKRELLMVTQTLMLLQAIALGVLTITGVVQLWHIYVLALFLGLVSALDNPARQAFVVELVGRERVVNAVSLNSAQFNGARLVGPAIGGAMIAAFGVGVCFFVNAGSFLAMLVGLFFIRPAELRLQPPRVGDAQRVLAQLGEGLRFVFGRKDMVTVILLIAGLGCFGFNWGTVIPLLATDALHSDASGFGLLMTGFGIGALLSALVFAGIKTNEKRLILAATAFSIIYFLVGFAPWFGLAFGLLALLGVCAMGFAPGANSLLQLKSPDELRGRVMGLYTMLMAGSTPVGAMVTGLLTNVIGIRLTIAAEAAVCGLSVLGAVLYRARARAGAEALPSASALAA